MGAAVVTAPINGKPTPAKPLDPRTDVARAVWEAQSIDGDPAFSELTEDQREDLAAYAEAHIAAHAQWLDQHGFRIIAPGAVPRPTSEPEALAMVQAAKAFFDAQKRRGKLMAGAVPKKLILPPGVH